MLYIMHSQLHPPQTGQKLVLGYRPRNLTFQWDGFHDLKKDILGL